MPRLSLKVVILHFNVAYFELQGTVCVSQLGDFALEVGLRITSFGLGLLVFRLRCGCISKVRLLAHKVIDASKDTDLPFVDFIPQALDRFL